MVSSLSLEEQVETRQTCQGWDRRDSQSFRLTDFLDIFPMKTQRCAKFCIRWGKRLCSAMSIWQEITWFVMNFISIGIENNMLTGQVFHGLWLISLPSLPQPGLQITMEKGSCNMAYFVWPNR